MAKKCKVFVIILVILSLLAVSGYLIWLFLIKPHLNNDDPNNSPVVVPVKQSNNNNIIPNI